MALASSLRRATFSPSLVLRPASPPSLRAFSAFPLLQALAKPPFPTQSRKVVPPSQTTFLSGGAEKNCFQSATWRPVIGRGGSRSQTTMASADKPIQLYSLATPNGQKIGIFLEEAKIPYEAHLIDISKGEQFTPEFLKINPNGKIPAIVDPNGPGGKEVRVFESGAILLYLAEKYKSPLYPKDPQKKADTLGWLFWQVGGLGPMLGQVSHFYRYAKEDVPYGKQRYLTEGKRLLEVLDKALEGKEYLVGEYTIADIASFPWVRAADNFDKEILDLDSYPNAKAWVDRIGARPQVQKGVTVCGR